MEEQLLYVHKLNAQELGYRNGSARKAGKYIYISKKYISYFPPLSNNIKNDHILIDIIPPYSNKIFLTKYVYHNDKLTDSKINGRNEFRIYFNEGINRNGDYYQPNDIVLLQRTKIDDSATYKLYKFDQIKHGATYRLLDTLLLKYDNSKLSSHALIPFSELSFLKIPPTPEVDVTSKELPNDIRETIFTEPIGEATPQDNESIRKIRNANFRDLVLMFYDYKCAITGTKQLIEYGNLSNLEAAHIYAFSKNGGNNPSNGIPLIRDLHWAFDNGFITLTNDYRIKVHDKAMNIEYLAAFDNQAISVPEDSRARPNLQSVEWHRDNVFGQFVRK